MGNLEDKSLEGQIKKIMDTPRFDSQDRENVGMVKEFLTEKDIPYSEMNGGIFISEKYYPVYKKEYKFWKERKIKDKALIELTH